MPKKVQGKDRLPRKRWTIAVFMVGAPELGPSLNRDLLELERAGSNNDVNVIVSVSRTPGSESHWFEIPQRAGDGPTRRQAIGGSDQRKLDDRLQEFLALAVKDFPAHHYVLIMWGHASGLRFGRLEPGSIDDQVRLGELATVLHTFREAREKKLEILGFCACALSKAEFALELRDEVDYLVSSQVGISTLMTWPFDDVVELALVNPSVEPAELAREIVHTFEESYEPPPVGLTALDLTQSEDISKHVNALSRAILDALALPGDVGVLNNLCVLHAFTEALDDHPYDFEPVVDFFDLCRKLVQEENLDAAVRERARSILNRGFRSFVVENARSGPKLGALHGLSILAPDLDSPDLEDTCRKCSKDSKDSSKAYLWQSTDWGRMVEVVREFATSQEGSVE